jgi:hypothetical protein
MQFVFSFSRPFKALLFFALVPLAANASNSSSDAIALLCKEIGSKLGSVSITNCEQQGLINSE